ncbi:MAG TPA: hypothetical protein VGH91_09245 [Gammaproteobacteria bacterium]|jgi:hypothetical protein
MKLRTLLFTALLALAGSVFGATPPPAAGTGVGPGSAHQGPCEKDPAKCQADAAKFDQWCQANAQKCMNLKSWAEKRIERCEKDPQKCEEMKQKMQQAHQQICQTDPSKPHCHALRANHQPNDNDQTDDQPPPPPAD